MRSKRNAASKVKYVETTEEEEDSSTDDDEDGSSVNQKVTASKASKGKRAPVGNTTKKIRKGKGVANKDDAIDAEPVRMSIIRNSSAIQHSSPLGSSDWRSYSVIDY